MIIKGGKAFCIRHEFYGFIFNVHEVLYVFTAFQLLLANLFGGMNACTNLQLKGLNRCTWTLLIFPSRNVLVKGGDLPDSLDAIDIFFDGMLKFYRILERQWYLCFLNLMYAWTVNSQGSFISMIFLFALQAKTALSCAHLA